MVPPGSACTGKGTHHVLRWRRVNCAACRPGQCLQLCPCAWPHSHVLAVVVATAENVTSTTLSGAVMFSSVTVLAVWRLYDPVSIVSDCENPELVPQMKFMARVAQLLVDLVKASAGQSGSTLRDHCPSSPAQVSDTLETRSQDADIRAQGATPAAPRSDLSARSVSPSMATESWATPTAAVWQDKSTIALRALSTLHWLSKPGQLQKLTAEVPDPSRSATENFQLCTAAHQAVGEALLRLLHCCLAGELPALWAPLRRSAITASMRSRLSW